MLGKIVQLRGVPLEDGFKVEYGIDAHSDGTINLKFAKLMSITTDLDVDVQHLTYTYGQNIKDEADGFKDILIHNFNVHKNDVEEYLLVIIPYSASIETTARKIAGRQFHEAILEMHSGDTVKVTKGDDSIQEVYMAVQAGNEMFLVKKNR